MPKGVFKRTEQHNKNLSLAWNYDKHFTKECRDKISKKLTGGRRTKEQIENMRESWNRVGKREAARERMVGDKNPMKREEMKKIISEKRKEYWAKNIGVRKEASIRMKKYYKDNPNARDAVSKFMKEYHNKPQVKKKFRELMKYIVTPTKDTKIEIKIQNFLRQLNVEFLTHQYIKIKHGYQCDILIPSMNLVIECDGDYWHNYPKGLDKDHIRTDEMIKAGFKVLRLWENKIKIMDIGDFENELNKFISHINRGKENTK